MRCVRNSLRPIRFQPEVPFTGYSPNNLRIVHLKGCSIVSRLNKINLPWTPESNSGYDISAKYGQTIDANLLGSLCHLVNPGARTRTRGSNRQTIIFGRLIVFYNGNRQKAIQWILLHIIRHSLLSSVTCGDGD